MSTYPEYRESLGPRPPRSPNLWPLLIVLVLGGALLWYFWPRGRDDGLHPDAVPRAITPRGDLAESEKSIVELYQVASKSVVHITTQTVGRNIFLGGREIAQGTGSGIVWDQDGHILTNSHVIQGANTARVTLADGTSWPAESVLFAPEKDLAILSVKVDRKDRLHPIALGTSHDLKVGQFAYAIGNPYGLDQSLSWGIISALDREIESNVPGRTIKGVIQTDAAINPGNSGGPLLDSAGRLIGVNTAIVSPSRAFAGIGFAIPVDDVRQIVTQLIRKGRVTRPILGIIPVRDQAARRLGVPEGVLIRDVEENMPAGRAGLRGSRLDEEGTVILGDVIVAIGGKRVKTLNDLFDILDRHKPGDTVTVRVLRGGAELEIEVTLDEEG